jgi:hypothetical protein
MTRRKITPQTSIRRFIPDRASRPLPTAPRGPPMRTQEAEPRPVGYSTTPAVVGKIQVVS